MAMLGLYGQAMAATTNLGPQAAPSSLYIGDTFYVPQNQFYDEFMFSIPTASFNSITSTINLGDFLGINNLQARLYSGTVPTTGYPGAGNLLQAWSSTSLFSGPGFNGTVAVISPITLGIGNYILEIRGDVVGSAGGSYSGTLNITPVPEAGEWAMILSGLGLVGLIGARRSRNAGVA